MLKSAILVRGVSPISAVLKNSNYRLYFLGQFVSLTGTWAQAVALSWLVYRMTGSATSVGLISFASQIPAFLISPFAGAIADRWERRRIFIVVQWAGMIQATLLALLVFSSLQSLSAILVLAVVLGCINGFEITTRHSLAIDIVERPDLQGAIALNAVLMNGTRVVGPAIAGILIQSVGEKWCFLLNAISYAAIVLTLSRMHFRPQLRPERTAAVGRSILEGFGYVRNHPRMIRILTASAAMSALTAAYTVLLPVFSRKVLGGDADVYAWLNSVGAVGAVLGALSVGHRAPTRGLRLQLALTLLWVGGVLSIFALSTHLVLSLGCALLFGYHTIRFWPLMNNALQQEVDDSMRGRVMAIFTMTFLGATPVASLLIGSLGDRLGSQPTLVATSGAALLGAITLLAPKLTRALVTRLSGREFSRSA